MPSYGGGGPGQISGDGSSDIRLEPGDYGDFNGLKSRIIVAAGAGSSDGVLIDGTYYYDLGGAGGGLFGFNSTYEHGIGANQTSGGPGKGHAGTFGFGAGDPNRRESLGDNDGNGGGGGGYFGGGNSDIPHYAGGGGGSSFISGYKDCIAILSSSTKSDIKFSNSIDPSIHYSGYKFTDGLMIDGKTSMPSPHGGTETGHEGNGYIRITQFETYLGSCSQQFSMRIFSYSIVIIVES
ncbi:glycine-rich protein family [Trichomonas vaginalis G3]|uniref:glycine-rich protein family n=1 Tax=Trichomonas vaginalis (strain ATCC PRA-98 / G3) TaxID=412133 RepID=UPI0021E55515|nr:glycine-rich protein family [Trichomonas vaginalis G3]XP_051094381.1 glycine-rich protein family [Trichomonas vaginalis G3]KAI5516912.1 glycine-rich protein family [Trichomonas vaginalis G3]KAI5517019.1 glycine-rich protein family [Trichomonas vaginalis G3]